MLTFNILQSTLSHLSTEMGTYELLKDRNGFIFSTAGFKRIDHLRERKREGGREGGRKEGRKEGRKGKEIKRKEWR